MKKTILLLLLACQMVPAFAQLNMTLTDQIDYTQNLSSLWGYIDPEDSTEYAAVGTSTGLAVVDLTDPYDVQEIAFVPDVNSSWREVKSWGHYIFAVTEGGGGMLVVNMNNPANVTSTHWAPNIPGLGVLNKVHSITVDEFGFLYLNGSNLNGGGPLIVDVSADNGNPVYVGKMPAIYCHDSYARNNILFTSDIYAGNFKVYNITDKANPVLLATQQTPFNFTHNTWLNDASDVVFTADEKANAPVTAYDISDLGNIMELDQFRPEATIGIGTIPHNVHVWNDWVVTAYYTNGTIIIDGSRPENMIEVGNFDSFVSNPAGFFGVWGVYPYFPSGIVIASDMQNGLLVYDVNYVRACWLEGKVTNAITSAAVSGATVSISSPQANAGTSDLLGNYETGQAIPGVFDVTFSATGYFPKTVPATLENGVLTILDVALEPLVINPFPPFSYTAPTAGCAPLTIDFFENTGVVASWSWTFENGNPATSTEQNPIVEFTVPGFHDISLQLVTMGGNTYNLAADDLVVIAPSPTAAFTNSVDSLTVSFANGSTNYNNLQWDFGDGSTSTDANPQHSYHGAGTYTVTLTTYGDCGSGVFTQDITIGPFVPVAGFEANMATGCAPLTVAFTDQSSNSPTDWAWSFPGGNPASSTEQNPTVTYNSGGSFDVQLTASNSAGSSQSFQGSLISIGEGPVAGFSATINGPEAQFSNTSTGSGVTYTWDFGDGGISGEQNPLHTFAAPGTYNVYLTINNNCGTSTFLENITISYFLPVAGFNANITAGCAPLSVTFTDQSSGQPDTWQWSFPGGDPASSMEQNPVVTYSISGTYSATLVVENNWGSAELAQSNLITINSAPTADFNFSINGTEVSFVNNSNNALTYEWLFNDGSGNTSTEFNPVHNFQGAGTYEVVLIATNDCGTATYSANVIISAIAPTAAFTLNNMQGCAPVQVQFTDQSAGGPTAWAWSFPGGSPTTSPEQNPIVTYTISGSYSAMLTVTNSAGSSETTQMNIITVDAAPFAAFDFTVNGLDISFTNFTMYATSYLWDFGDGSTSMEDFAFHTYAANGTYTVVLTATNDCGSTSFEQEVVIAVAPPNANFIASLSGICAPVVVEFNDLSTGIVTGWDWAFPGGTPATSTEQNPI
ncbi:MAG: choice-of-anchor B family protein, partial [Bacteroidetes bacterium]|nr:choice-of-anchor B family protein [Bacteroidota bacterium]